MIVPVAVPVPVPAAAAVDYRDPAAWLCRPGRVDACVPDAVRTVVAADGGRTTEIVPRAGAPKADCFYVYPTASNDSGANSDMVVGIEEKGQAASQFAAFAGVCRTFAPVYRQVTLTALHAGRLAQADWGLAYGDVRAAFADYLAHDNAGRPFVLIGHSQGSALLKRLVAEEVDGRPLARRLLSAVLPGTTVLVPRGRAVGGDFRALPLCAKPEQTGCIVTWASYRDTAPPPATALFGRVHDRTMAAGCTNPADLGAGPDDPPARLDTVAGFPWWHNGFVQYRAPADWPFATRFARVAGVSGRCVAAGDFSYLSVDIAGPAAAVMAPAVVGDAAYPEWGLHVIDIHLVQGDLVRLVAAQTAAWTRANAD